jgi:hypothetical protein
VYEEAEPRLVPQGFVEPIKPRKSIFFPETTVMLARLEERSFHKFVMEKEHSQEELQEYATTGTMGFFTMNDIYHKKSN